jgi:hypothetical protein
MVLDECLGASGCSPRQVQEAASLYSGRWKPEAEAVSWVAERHLAEDRCQNLRAHLTHTLFGLSVVGETKRSDISYAEAMGKAKRLWPLW